MKPGGDASLAKLEAENGPLPPTLTVRTGSGGRHKYFRCPGTHVGNSAGQLGRGLDVRGAGGYLIAPPSVHPDGGVYAREEEREIADLPPWLLNLVAAPREVPAPVAAAPSKERGDFGDSGGTRFHALRHTFATHILAGGGAITDLQAQLSHSKVSTTQRYTRMVDERRKVTVLALDYGTKAANGRSTPAAPDRSNSASTGG